MKKLYKAVAISVLMSIMLTGCSGCNKKKDYEDNDVETAVKEPSGTEEAKPSTPSEAIDLFHEESKGDTDSIDTSNTVGDYSEFLGAISSDDSSSDTDTSVISGAGESQAVYSDSGIDDTDAPSASLVKDRMKEMSENDDVNLDTLLIEQVSINGNNDNYEISYLTNSGAVRLIIFEHTPWGKYLVIDCTDPSGKMTKTDLYNNFIITF